MVSCQSGVISSSSDSTSSEPSSAESSSQDSSSEDSSSEDSSSDYISSEVISSEDSSSEESSTEEISSTSDESSSSEEISSSEDSSSSEEEISSSSDNFTRVDASNDYDGYYSGIDFSLTGADLKSALSSLIGNPSVVGYAGLWTAYYTTDTDEEGYIIDMYSAYKYTPGDDQAGNYSAEGQVYNREHTIPQSVFENSGNGSMKSDLFHVYPTDGYVNGRRSNYVHANVGTSVIYTSTNNTLVGTGDSSLNGGVSLGTVCEPADEYKGDFARTYFYFVTCYESYMTKMGTYAAFSGDSYPSLKDWALEVYMQWSEEDPVSEREIERCQLVYGQQNNRNPFIDYPGLESQIWSLE